MKRALLFILGWMACSSVLLPVVAGAEVRCPEGKTLTGECVNAALAATLRETANIFSQPKISRTTLPVLPAQDFDYRYPNQLIPDPNQPPAVRVLPGGVVTQ